VKCKATPVDNIKAGQPLDKDGETLGEGACHRGGQKRSHYWGGKFQSKNVRWNGPDGDKLASQHRVGPHIEIRKKRQGEHKEILAMTRPPVAPEQDVLESQKGKSSKQTLVKGGEKTDRRRRVGSI